MGLGLGLGLDLGLSLGLGLALALVLVWGLVLPVALSVSLIQVLGSVVLTGETTHLGSQAGFGPREQTLPSQLPLGGPCPLGAGMG